MWEFVHGLDLGETLQPVRRAEQHGRAAAPASRAPASPSSMIKERRTIDPCSERVRGIILKHRFKEVVLGQLSCVMSGLKDKPAPS